MASQMQQSRNIHRRDPAGQGIVVRPVVGTNQCRYCRAKGHHMRSWNRQTRTKELTCPKLIAKEERKRQRDRRRGRGRPMPSSLNLSQHVFHELRRERRRICNNKALGEKDDFTVVGRQRSLKAMAKGGGARTKVANSFSALNDNNVHKPVQVQRGPAVCNPRQPTGAWGVQSSGLSAADAKKATVTLKKLLGIAPAPFAAEAAAAAAIAAACSKDTLDDWSIDDFGPRGATARSKDGRYPLFEAMKAEETVGKLVSLVKAPKQVRFAGDSENRMKPPCKTKVFHKEDPPIAISGEVEEEEPKLVIGKSAWRPKSIPQGMTGHERQTILDEIRTKQELLEELESDGAWADGEEIDTLTEQIAALNARLG